MGRLAWLSNLVLQALASASGKGILAALFVLTLVTLLLVPVPTPILDFLLAVNITGSLLLLLIGVFGNVGKFFAFPSLVLLATLFRLSLNVSSTRLILLHGDDGRRAAGRVIEAFGDFVVQGDFIVGGMIFVIIAIVNFVVITRGASRVAEVAARFMLDSMPGKQLAIDADFRGGNISYEQASRERAELIRESQFYGAMDGAMKFVQGDAIAGFVITFVNAIGGVGIGLSRGMEFGDAVSSFGVLTIGDGLVTILPALFVSICSGLVVTRVGEKMGSDSAENRDQAMLSISQGLLVVCLASIFLAILPVFPPFPFLLIAGVSLLGFLVSGRRRKNREKTALFEHQVALDQGIFGYQSADGALPGRLLPAPESSIKLLQLELEPKLHQALDRSSSAALLFRSFAELQARFYQERGIVIPDLQLSKAGTLENGSYRVLVREREIRSGRVRRDALFICCESSFLEVLHVATGDSARHPLHYRPGCWVNEDGCDLHPLQRIGAEMLGWEQFLAYEIAGAALDVPDELIGVSEVKNRVQSLKPKHAALIEEVFDARVLSYAEFTDTLKKLVREQVSIRDLKLILEGVLQYAAGSNEIGDRLGWLAELHAHLRRVLARGIIESALGPGGKLRTFLLSGDLEVEFREAAAVWDRRKVTPPLPPELQGEVRETAAAMFRPVLERGNVPIVVLCAADVRYAVQEFFRTQLRSKNWLRAISYDEVGFDIEPETVGVVEGRVL